MTQNQTKSMFQHKIRIVIFILTIVFTISAVPCVCQAKKQKATWKKEITSLRVGKTFRYHIKGCSKKANVRYSSNHISWASINRKTGLLRARRKGVVIITAKIKEPHKKIKKLKTKVRITAKGNTRSSSAASASAKKDLSHTYSDNSTNQANAHSSTLLDHVQFTASETINPWNHSLLLYSNRILLQSEVRQSTLTLSRIQEDTVNNSATNGNNNTTKLTAHFCSLSDDGKTILYRLSNLSAQEICPGNGTQDGDYKITSEIFSDTLFTHYQERIQPNSICGFATTTKGTALSNVSVTLYSNTSDIPLASVKTDQNGYYQFHDIAENTISLIAQLENYDTYSLSSLHPGKQMLCQNIIMHPISTEDLALSCEIMDLQKLPVTNATVLITDQQDNPVIQGKVDSKGLITFANRDINTIKGYSLIDYHNKASVARYQTESISVSNPVLMDREQPFTRSQQYHLYVIPGTSEVSTSKDYHMVSFTFSFMPLLSDQLVLQIHLDPLPIISSDTLSIDTTHLSDTFSHLDYTLYDNRGNTVFHTTLASLADVLEHDYSDSLSRNMQDCSLRLYDGNYYAAISAKTPSDQAVSATTIHPVHINHGIIEPVAYLMTPTKDFHVIIYAKFYCDTNDRHSYTLYQKTDTTWLPLDTYSSGPFTSITTTSSKAYLNLTALQSDTTYCLISTETDYSITSGAIFHTSSDWYDSMTNSAPDHQIILTDISDQANHIDTPINPASICNLSDYKHLCKEQQCLDASFFASAAYYPNTIYAYYQTDGTFCNLFLATPNFLSSQSDSPTPSIYNRLHNGDMMYTSQTAYRMTPFFVT